jgi:MinD superfamily P-loop ATPase
MECLMFHLKNRYKIAEAIWEGHETAIVNQSLCIGCGACQKICQFEAIVINGKKATVNDNCFGCGVCRGFCPMEAIQLIPRIKFETAGTGV